MALDYGQCRTDAPAVSGLAGRLWLALGTRSAYAGMVASLAQGTSARDAVAALLESVAHGVVRALTDDMVVTVTIPIDGIAPGVPSVEKTFVAVVT